MYPSYGYLGKMPECVVASYNALLASHRLIDDCDVSVVLQNGQTGNIMNQSMFVRPWWYNVNKMMAKIIATATFPLRCGKDLQEIAINTNLQEYYTNMVPFPRLHFMLTALAPIGSFSAIAGGNKWTRELDVRSITQQCFHGRYFFMD